MSKYDIIIIGSGLGGLECGAILSKEGYQRLCAGKNEIVWRLLPNLPTRWAPDGYRHSLYRQSG